MCTCSDRLRRLQITVAKLIQELPERKRNGARVASSTATSLLFDKFKSASQATGLLNSIEFLPRMDAELKEQPKEVIRKLEELRNHRKHWL
jgi:Zn-dependent M16 (insulinase) family peptidase